VLPLLFLVHLSAARNTEVGDGSPGSREAEGDGGEDFYIAEAASVPISLYHPEGGGRKREKFCGDDKLGRGGVDNVGGRAIGVYAVPSTP
jgi:hypothetical protein